MGLGGSKSDGADDHGACIACDSPSDFEKTLSEAGSKTVFVDFTATWCPPCRMIGPKFVGFSNQYSDAVFVKVDVDKNKETSGKHGVKAMPTFMAFKNGQKIDELVGADPSKLEAMIKKHK
mmetsp:Transcript_44212/g.104053  ORF Transcript_44212/g.104053 Transcript_44212/m.104053 type:complete len:121 (-) Transcript_44212:73-435(-)